MVSTGDIQRAVFFIIGLVSIVLTAVFRSAELISILLDYYPWLEGFDIKWATTVYDLVAFISLVIVVFLSEAKGIPEL